MRRLCAIVAAGAEWYFGAYLAQVRLGRRSMLEQGCPKLLRGCLAVDSVSG